MKLVINFVIFAGNLEKMSKDELDELEDDIDEEEERLFEEYR